MMSEGEPNVHNEGQYIRVDGILQDVTAPLLKRI
jgi:hypothetical protein